MVQYVVLKASKELALVSTFLPEKALVWNEKNSFLQRVPVKLEYVDSFGEKKVVTENFPQLLCDNYPELELFEEEAEPPVVQPKKKGRPKKSQGENDEEVH